MRPRSALHPDLVAAIRVLDAIGLPYAEMWRTLGPIAARAGARRPSYWHVRRFVREERLRKAARDEELDLMLRDYSRGQLRLPRVLQHKPGSYVDRG